ncbi:MAG: hypothetical protein J0I96_02485 [Rhodanobacter sp.]|nr:hypothetical protein [Rhodanobacter sp.]ODU74436.1 MAG: hypothetical protein ABT17_07415 [Rhodanobacter sp. SCN 69-32]
MSCLSVSELPAWEREQLSKHARQGGGVAFDGPREACAGEGARRDDGLREGAAPVAWSAMSDRARREGDHWPAK